MTTTLLDLINEGKIGADTEIEKRLLSFPDFAKSHGYPNTLIDFRKAEEHLVRLMENGLEISCYPPNFYDPVNIHNFLVPVPIRIFYPGFIPHCEFCPLGISPANEQYSKGNSLFIDTPEKLIVRASENRFLVKDPESRFGAFIFFKPYESDSDFVKYVDYLTDKSLQMEKRE